MSPDGLDRWMSVDSDMDLAMRINNSIHRKGPGVDPWPGPNRGVSWELLYEVEDIPYLVRQICQAAGCGKVNLM